MIEPALPRGTSAAAIQHHYDEAPRFFALWLDPLLTYSCGMWDGAQSLEEAQTRKMDYHAARSGAIHANRVLDIGCGFGGLMRRLADVHEVKHVVGLTLSQTQAGHVATWADPRLEARLESWEIHTPESPYDAIISVGALEHAARFGMTSREKTDAYRHFFARCRTMLRPGGRMSLQAIAKGNTTLDRKAAEETLWILENIYPESDAPRLLEIANAAEKQFEIAELRNDRLDYARTCAKWLERLRARRAEALQVVDEKTYVTFERYLAICVDQFRLGHSTLLRMELARV